MKGKGYVKLIYKGLCWKLKDMTSCLFVFAVFCNESALKLIQIFLDLTLTSSLIYKN